MSFKISARTISSSLNLKDDTPFISASNSINPGKPAWAFGISYWLTSPAITTLSPIWCTFLDNRYKGIGAVLKKGCCIKLVTFSNVEGRITGKKLKANSNFTYFQMTDISESHVNYDL